MKHSFKFASGLIKKYSRKSIFYEYLKKLFLLITLPFLILLLSIYCFHRNAAYTEAMYYTGKSFDSAVLSVNNIFKEISDNLYLYSEDIYVQMFLTTSAENHSRLAKNYSPNILNQFMRSVAASSVINSISIYAFENDYIISSSGGGFSDKFAAYDWFEYYKKSGETNFTLSSVNPHTKEKTLTSALGIYSGTIPSGMIIFEVKSSDIDRLVLGSLSRDYNKFYLLDESGGVLYSSPNAVLSENEKLFLTNPKNGKNNGVSKQNNMTYSLKQINSPGKISLLYVKDLRDISSASSKLNLLFILCIIIALFMPAAISLYVSANFYNSISKIITLLNVNDKEADEINEFTFISNHIVDILGKNKSIEKELVQKTAVFKKSQALALQTQLNPHFLFNTLHLIGLSARVLLKGKNPVTTTVSLLSQLLVAALDTQNYIVTVEEEMNYAKKYLEIQQLRYQNNFDVIWNIDENVLECKTIKLILQPLIENSFLHGISFLDDKRGVITISAKESGSSIILEVKDNGKEIPENKLEEIRSRLETEDLPEKNHIGLINVNMRLKLVYGESSGITITSSPGGTSVFIHFPKETPHTET